MNAQQKFISTSNRSVNPDTQYCYHAIEDKSANVHGVHAHYASVNDQSNVGYLVLLVVSPDELEQLRSNGTLDQKVDSWMSKFAQNLREDKLSTTRTIWQIGEISCTNNFAVSKEFAPKTSRNLMRGSVVIFGYVNKLGTAPSNAEQRLVLQGFSSG